MKKLILTLTASLACVAAFAQGKLQFATDSLHLVYYDPSSGQANSGGTNIAGTAVSSANMPNGVTLVADLYGGTSSTALSLVSTTVFGTVAGRWTGANTTFTSPALPAGTAAFFQIQIRDNAHATATLAQADVLNGYYAFSDIFSAVPQPSSFNPIYQATSPVFSTWAAGTYNLDSVATGFRGAIDVHTPIIPEPSSFALAGIGLAAVTILRRRR